VSLPALQSLYGAKTAADRLCGNVGGQAREQETWTPSWVWDVVFETFSGPPALDPFAASSPEGQKALENWTLPDYVRDLERAIKVADPKDPSLAEAKREIKKAYRAGSLLLPWRETNYCNPAFAFLQEALAKIAEEAKLGRKILALYPVRTNRPWWPRAHKAAGAEVVYLRYDVVFQGHKSAFPASLCLSGWNVRVPDLGPRETDRRQF
jgi:hypothetical protein